MKTYSADRIKNIAIVGHGGSGKTSLVEALLYRAGATDRLGKITDGTTVSDYDPEEIKRKASLTLSVLPLEYNDYKINLFDTPGLFDFAAGMYEGINAADSVCVTISGKSGVTVGAKKAYKLAKKDGKPTMFFVSKLDTENADFYKVLEDLKANFGPSVCPLMVPVYDGHTIECYVDLINMKAYRYEGNFKRTEVPMPDMAHRLEGLLAAISEAVAETDEEMFEKYFSGEQFTHDEIVSGVHAGIKNGSICPVFCGSAVSLEGITVLLEGITQLMPSANEAVQPLPCDPNGPLCAYVFKTIADPFFGKLSFFKVLSGKLSAESEPVNMTTGAPERIGKLMFLRGKKQEDTKEIIAGDIGAATKLNVNTGDTLCSGTDVKIDPPEFPEPCYSMAVQAKGKGDESKISAAITKLLQEDLTLWYHNNTETKQQVLTGLGEQHLDVAVSKLKSKFGVDVELTDLRIPYRETIRKKVKVEGKHKKQTGGHGQFGHVWIEFEPCMEEELVFEERVFGGAVPKGFFPAVEKGLRDSSQKGILAGYPVVGLKAILVDGSYHPVDSSEMAFKTAAGIAYREGIPQASPVILEPICTLNVLVPDNNTGDMMGELNKRRGRVLGMNPSDEEEGMTVIEAEVPMAEMQDFTMLLRQMTQGSGSFKMEFARYEQLPDSLQATVISKANAMKASE
ncbi:MAG: elongation factor G [Massilioclostridium sp.]|nr:elongation factor G [Massilioclostridium sp.]